MDLMLFGLCLILPHISVSENVTFINNGSEPNPMQDLQQHLFSNYGNGLVRPVRDGKSPTIVTFRLLLHSLLEMDTRNQKFKIFAWVKMQWIDEFLQWNSKHFGNIDVIHVPATAIWRPDITLHNNADDGFGIQKSNTMVQVNYNGSIIWYVPTIYGCSCKQRVRYFPFDTQFCPIRFSSWALDGSHIDLRQETGLDNVQSRFIGTGVWDFVTIKEKRHVITYPCCPFPYYELEYILVFKRQAAFYIAYLILPTVFLSGLSLLVFYLPPDCGEKLTLSITNLLALVVFQQLIAQTMPPSGDASPMIGTFFLIMIVMVVTSVLCTVLVIHIGFNSKKMPTWIKIIVIDFLAKAVCMNLEGSNTNEEEVLALNHENINSAFKDRNSSTINGKHNDTIFKDSKVAGNISSISGSLDFIKSEILSKADEDSNHAQWKHVSMVIDRCLLLFFGSFAIIVTVVMTSYVVVKSQQDFTEVTDSLK